MKNLIERFNSVTALKINLEREIDDVQASIQEYSNILGQKIRSPEETLLDDSDFLAFKAKLDESLTNKKHDNKQSDGKKEKEVIKTPEIKNTVEKKKKSKKGINDKWFDLNEIRIYNEIGVKGELELYFKTIDELKAKLENLQRTLSTLNNIIEKGLKENMGCMVFRGTTGTLELAFLKSIGFRKNFSLKSTYTGSAIPVEKGIKIGV